MLKKLIDKTAEFVADEGWEFDAWQVIVLLGSHGPNELNG